MSQIFEALCSNVSLYGCECARNEPTLSVVSPRCLQHCDVFVGNIIGRLTIRDYIYQVSAWCPPSKLVRHLQLHVFFHVIQRRNQTATNDLSSNRYVKNTLRIDSKQRLPCFCRYYGVNLVKSLAL